MSPNTFEPIGNKTKQQKSRRGLWRGTINDFKMTPDTYCCIHKEVLLDPHTPERQAFFILSLPKVRRSRVAFPMKAFSRIFSRHHLDAQPYRSTKHPLRRHSNQSWPRRYHGRLF